MNRVRLAVVAMLATVATAHAQPLWERTPAPEKVTFMGGVGGMFPVGRFSDVANSGVAPSIGGYIRLNRVLAPAFEFQYALLHVDDRLPGGGDSIHAFNILTGPRLFIPVKGPVHPWVTGLIGYARYQTDRTLPLEPLFGAGEHTRDDVMLSFGGGLDFQFHPNFSVGIDVRALFSLSTDTSSGAKNLTATSVSGLAMFHY